MFIVPPVRSTVPTLPPLLFWKMIVQPVQLSFAPVLFIVRPAPLSKTYVPGERVTSPLMSALPLKQTVPVGFAMVSGGSFFLLLGKEVQPDVVGSGTLPNGSA